MKTLALGWEKNQTRRKGVMKDAGRKLGEKRVREATGHWREVTTVPKAAFRSCRMRTENQPLD